MSREPKRHIMHIGPQARFSRGDYDMGTSLRDSVAKSVVLATNPDDWIIITDPERPGNNPYKFTIEGDPDRTLAANVRARGLAFLVTHPKVPHISRKVKWAKMGGEKNF